MTVHLQSFTFSDGTVYVLMRNSNGVVRRYKGSNGSELQPVPPEETISISKATAVANKEL